MGLRTLPVNRDYWINQCQASVYCASKTGNDVTGGRWKPHNQERRAFQSSLNIIFVIKLRIVGWTSNVERMRKKKNSYRLLMDKPEGNLLEYLGADMKILLKWV
jgi:cell division protein FtsI/penicillin-binding protein 2